MQSLLLSMPESPPHVVERISAAHPNGVQPGAPTDVDEDVSGYCHVPIVADSLPVAVARCPLPVPVAPVARWEVVVH